VRACFSLGDCTSCDIDAGGCSSLPSSLLLCHLFFFVFYKYTLVFGRPDAEEYELKVAERERAKGLL